MTKKLDLKKLTQREALLIETTYYLARGDEAYMGQSLEDIIIFLKTPMRGKDHKSMIECLSEDREVLDLLIKHLSSCS